MKELFTKWMYELKLVSLSHKRDQTMDKWRDLTSEIDELTEKLLRCNEEILKSYSDKN